MKIAFLGTSEFAATALTTLAASTHQLVHVYCKEPKQRSPKNALLAVELAAQQLQLPLTLVKSLKPLSWEETFRNLGVEALVVADFGLIIPANLLHCTKYGILNIHPSLLPRWRGAAPLQRCILAGDQETGVCILQVGEGIDDGKIFRCSQINLSPDTTSTSLSTQLATLGGKLMAEVLSQLPKIQPYTQAESGITYADKINKAEGLLDFQHMDALTIDRIVRALAHEISVYFPMQQEHWRVLQLRILDPQSQHYPAGTILDEDLRIQCLKGIVQPLVLQRPNKRALPLAEFRRGIQQSLSGKLLSCQP